MAEFVFAPATKEQEKARIALEGPSGSGKTWSALSIAQALGQRTAVIDTERGSASKYASDFSFDVCKLFTFDPRDLVKALAAAGGAGYDTVIVDSLSHFWMGAGGMLEQVDSFARRSQSGNSFAAWKDARPIEREMIDALLAFPGHVIVTMRTKSEWVITENDRGKKEPKKIGLKAEQRDGIEYEFDVVGALDLDHNLVISKSRISILADKVVNRPGPELGAQILGWLSDGVKLPSVADYITELGAASSAEQVRDLWRAVTGRNLGGAPCIGPNGEPTTLIALITARGAQLVPGAPTSVPAQPQPSAPQVQRSNGNPPDQDPWATAAPAASSGAPTTETEQATTVPAEAPKANAALLKTVNTEVTKRVGAKREDRLALISQIVGREINSTNDLTVAEARGVLDSLARADESNATPAGPTKSAPNPRNGGGPVVDSAAFVPELSLLLKRAEEPGGESVHVQLWSLIGDAATPSVLKKLFQVATEARDGGHVTVEQFAELDALGRAANDDLAAKAQTDPSWSHRRLDEMAGAGA